jgi:hypothetical protein
MGEITGTQVFHPIKTTKNKIKKANLTRTVFFDKTKTRANITTQQKIKNEKLSRSA